MLKPIGLELCHDYKLRNMIEFVLSFIFGCIENVIGPGMLLNHQATEW